MPWYYRVRNAINAAAPFLARTQTTNLALLVSAILKKQTLCLSELARAYPTPKERRVASPFQNYTRSEPRFRALLNMNDTRQRPEFVAIPGKPPLTP